MTASPLSYGLPRLKSGPKPEDITGQVFNHWTALEHLGRSKWLCKCVCGKMGDIRKTALKKGLSKSCGCKSGPARKAAGRRNAQHLTGQRFGRLTVVARAGSTPGRHATWLCRCDCGNELETIGLSLKQGKTTSCGCFQKECAVLAFRNEGHEAYREHATYASRKSFVYLVEVGRTVDKIGIAFDMTARRKAADYTQIWWKRQMTRAQCWAVEQVALHLTREYAPQEVYNNKHDNCGTTEQRIGWVIEDVIQLLEQLCDECAQMGWETFYSRYLT